ncbi:hypothetical protein [Streptomyces fumanus]|uniref:hypothetical protein n=1 Tax=Streptomyces fumanus TaxID=67302 RepID=UPI0033F0A931
MSQLIAAATGAGVAVAVGLTAVARAVRPHGRHRAPRHTAGPGRPRPAEDRPAEVCDTDTTTLRTIRGSR